MNSGTILLYQWLTQGTLLLFVFATGACAGSFLNVVAYRLPRGQSVVSPPSACPGCRTALGWRENLPLFGWLLLRGKCRHCGMRISPQYVLMEFVVAVLFAALWIIWGVDERALSGLGVHLGFWRPEWVGAGMVLMWPMFMLAVVLVGALVVSTLIDAQTFTIPAVIPWITMALGLVVHPVLAVFVAREGGLPGEHVWTIPAPASGFAWPFVFAGLGGLAGLLVANSALALKLIPRSFADFEEWEREAQAAEDAAKNTPEDAAPTDAQPAEPDSLRGVLVRTLLLTGPAVAGMFAGTLLMAPAGNALPGLALGGALGLLLGAVLRSRVATPDASDAPLWAHYPHARREMVKECLFLLPVVGLMVAGLWLGLGRAAPVEEIAATGELVSLAEPPPLWLTALGASAVGALVGGGVVWAVRILGSFAFGKEAMGLGDVHLMAGVGAVLGWADPLLAFFVAPFFGIAWAVLAPLLGKLVRLPTMLPYGPHLALATLLILYAKPAAEGLLTLVLRSPVNLP